MVPTVYFKIYPLRNGGFRSKSRVSLYSCFTFLCLPTQKILMRYILTVNNLCNNIIIRCRFRAFRMKIVMETKFAYCYYYDYGQLLKLSKKQNKHFLTMDVQRCPIRKSGRPHTSELFTTFVNVIFMRLSE